MDTVTLRTGTEIPKPLLAVTLVNLQELLTKHFIEFYELVQLARNPDHQLFGNSAVVLRAWGFMDGTRQLQSTIREIVLAAVEGDDFELTIVNPVHA